MGTVDRLRTEGNDSNGLEDAAVDGQNREVEVAPLLRGDKQTFNQHRHDNNEHANEGKGARLGQLSQQLARISSTGSLPALSDYHPLTLAMSRYSVRG